MRNLTAFLRNLLQWLGEAWAILGPIGIIAGHLIAINYLFPECHKVINQWTGFLATLTGVGFVIYGMNEKLNHFNAIGFKDIAASWFTKIWHLWPKKPTVVQLSGNADLSLSAIASATVVRDLKYLPLHLRLAAIESDISELQKSVGSVRADFHQRINENKTEILNRIERNKCDLDEVSKTIKEQAVGSVSHELFGALLAAYSLVVTTFFAMPK